MKGRISSQIDRDRLADVGLIANRYRVVTGPHAVRDEAVTATDE